MDKEFCSRYPFSSEAKQLIASSGISINDEVLEAGERRLLSALSDGAIPKPVAAGEDAVSREVAAYAAARMILASLKNRFLLNRYAIAEAKRARDYLNGESDANLEILANELGITFSKSESSLLLPAYQYLRFSPKSVDYKLVNRELKGGKVSVSRAQLTRLMEEAIRKHIEGNIPQNVDFPTPVLETAERLKREIPKHEPQGAAKIESSDYPPCIKKLLEDLALNENLPHTARWSLCTYLINAGMPVDAIIKIFSSAPDFNLQTTAYQVDYIRKKGYSIPSCATLDTYGICVANCRCGSPKYYKKPKFTRGEREEMNRVEMNTK